MYSDTNRKNIRFGIILAFIIYGIFGFLDPLMLPVHYVFAWKFRFLVLYPLLLICLPLTYFKYFEKIKNYMIILILMTGQLGILAMIYVSSSSEPAFHGYYVGLILMILASEFIFRMKALMTFVFFLLTGIAYFLIAGVHQKMLFGGSGIIERNWFIGNMFFLTSAAAISLMGSHRIYLYKKRINLEVSRYQIARDEAEEANRLKSAFLRNISHEIRTPLNGIIGFSKMICQSEPDENEKEQYLKIIDYSSSQLIDIVDSIIYMSEIQTGKAMVQYQQVLLRDTLEDIAKQFVFQAEMNHIEFKTIFNIPGEQQMIRTDVQKLRFVINNLLSNALKFTTEGYIKLDCTLDKETVIFRIEDSGIGMDEEHLEKIFDPFYQVDKGYNRKFGGNGLGLAICKSYVSMLGGEITVESQKGKGSFFEFSHPV